MNFKKSYSQCGEDLIIAFLFESMLNVHNISYLDIGANDPIHLNNTYHFYEKGFRGVCVDPNPLFKSPYKSNRPEDIFLIAGAGPKKGNIEFFEIDPHTLSTFSEETAKQYVEEDHHKLVKTYKVPVLTVSDLRKRFFKESSMPNLLSIDIEGWDYEIISTLDLESWSPTVICMETLTYSTQRKQHKIKPLIDLLKRKGYFVYADTYINTIFVNNNDWAKRGSK